MLKHIALYTLFFTILVSMTACSSNKNNNTSVTAKDAASSPKQLNTLPVVYEKRSPKSRIQAKKPRSSSVNPGSFASKLSDAAISRLRSRVRYDGAYIKIAYPWGDVPPNIGVCTDVVIRSYRKLGIDLQQQVHQDMTAAFNAYPNLDKWRLSKPDTNIDHRRVYNLRAFFARRGAALPITNNPSDYKPGDLVTWMVGKDLPHIGVVVNKRSKADPNRFMIVHNIAYGPQMEDILFRFPISGHYRYTPAHMGNIPKPTYAMNTSRNTLNNAQLIQAASILSASPVTPQKVSTSKPAQKAKSIQLATLTEVELQALLKN